VLVVAAMEVKLHRQCLWRGLLTQVAVAAQEMVKHLLMSQALLAVLELLFCTTLCQKVLYLPTPRLEYFQAPQ
jgi:hypothetical protein